MHEKEVKKELKQIKDKLVTGISIMVEGNYAYIYYKNKKIGIIGFDNDQNIIIKTDKKIIKG